jgi:hypothetical protein
MGKTMTTWQRWLRSVFPASWLARLRLPHVFMEVLVALSLAFLVWLYARSRHQETLDQVPIPVQVSLAPAQANQYDLEINGSSRAPVSFTGPVSCMRDLREKLQRGAVRVSLTLTVPEERQNDSIYRDTVFVEAADVPVPAGVTASLVEVPFCIPVTVHKLVERRLPVRLDYAGDTHISQVKLEPATVLVRGPKDVLDRARSIATHPCAAPPPSEAGPPGESLVRGDIALLHEVEGRPIQVTPETVVFRYRMQTRQKTYEIADVPVHFLCPPNFPWRPRFESPEAGRVHLRVTAPTGDEAPAVVAFVDLTHGEFTQGRNREPLRLQLAREAQLAQETPPAVTFYLDPLNTTATGFRGE